MDRISPNAAGPNGLYRVPEYRLGRGALSRMFVFVITHILYRTKDCFAHSFQNTLTQTAMGAGRSAGDV